jgi:hypothetical protein
MRHYLHDLATAFPDFWVEASRPSRRTACCSDRPPSRVGARSCPPLPHPPRPQVDQYATVDTGSITVMYHGRCEGARNARRVPGCAPGLACPLLQLPTPAPQLPSPAPPHHPRSATNLGEYHHHKPTRHTSTFQGE